MDSILNESNITFKDLEQKIFNYICRIGCEITSRILEAYNEELTKSRDKGKYRDKGLRTTSIKTVYGEVEYRRNVFKTTLDTGEKAYVYLLDEAMKMDKIGLLSTNFMEKLSTTITEATYRDTAKIISKSCGQSISPQGVWNAMQRLGERISEEEDHSVKEMEAEQAKGEREVPVLFEEMDGVWLNSQGEHHKKMKKQEMKVFTMYEGWDEEKEKQNRSTLVEKVMLAGMESSDEFHKKREATIQKKYNPDEIGQRILNGDGGSWIRETNDPEAIFQLDRFHIYQEILRKIADKEAQAEIRRLFDEEEIKKMFEYIETYATSVESNEAKDKRSQKARELYKYLDNNRNGLLPYDKRGVEIPKPRDGVIYKGMGIQENQNCTLITQRMKHRRMRWSKNGANNLAKILCRKENGELIETIDRFTDGLVFTLRMKEIVEILSAAKAPKRDGKGNPYIDIFGTHVPLKDAALTASRKAFLKIFG